MTIVFSVLRLALRTIGLLLFFFGGGFTYHVAADSDFTSPFHFGVRDPVVHGVVLSALPMHEFSGKYAIYEYHYAYHIAGQRFDGFSYADNISAEKGATVPVRYAPRRPSLSRIDNMRAAPFPWGLAVGFAIFPALGLWIIYLSRKKSESAPRHVSQA